MKKYLLSFPALLAAALLCGQTGKVSAPCGGCGQPAATNLTQYQVLSDGEKHIFVKGCVPGSDVEVYSEPGGGQVVMNATAAENGTARLVLPEKMASAFVLNHNRANQAGISGSGFVSFIQPAALILNDFEVSVSGTYVQVSCRAAAGAAPLQLIIERVNGSETAVVLKQQLQASGPVQLFPAMDDVKGVSQNGQLTYTVKVLNAGGEILFSKSKTAAVPQNTWADVVPTAFTSSVTVRIPAEKVPAEYTVFDLSGKKVMQRGRIHSQNQQIEVKVNPGQYLLQVNDGKGNTSTEKIIKQ